MPPRLRGWAGVLPERRQGLRTSGAASSAARKTDDRSRVAMPATTRRWAAVASGGESTRATIWIGTIGTAS